MCFALPIYVLVFFIIVCGFGFVWMGKESERKDSKERLLKI